MLQMGMSKGGANSPPKSWDNRSPVSVDATHDGTYGVHKRLAKGKYDTILQAIKP